MKIIIQTRRMVIHEFDPAEYPLLINLYNNEKVTKYVSRHTDAENKKIFEDTLNDYKNGIGLGRWGILNLANDEFIGVCILKPADSDTGHIELGYVLDEPYWGLGLATELTKGLLKYGFTEKHLTEICACTDIENEASQNVLFKAGFTREGNVFWHGKDLPFFKIRHTHFNC